MVGRAVTHHDPPPRILRRREAPEGWELRQVKPRYLASVLIEWSCVGHSKRLATVSENIRLMPVTRYQADATPYLDRTSTGRIAPALPRLARVLWISHARRWRGGCNLSIGNDG